MDSDTESTFSIANSGSLVLHKGIRFGLPPRNSNFVGRQKELQVMHKALVIDPPPLTTGQCALVSRGGIGKTQLAVEFAFEYAND
ncbi:hypothetical protein F5B20DRAFT_442083 [Whalleya microplaca]|nr:hypothetical protein F5B20DRAFT_442083 [Whalleya microplaca]